VWRNVIRACDAHASFFYTHGSICRCHRNWLSTQTSRNLTWFTSSITPATTLIFVYTRYPRLLMSTRNKFYCNLGYVYHITWLIFMLFQCFGTSQVRENAISLRKWSGCTKHLRTLEGTLGLAVSCIKTNNSVHIRTAQKYLQTT